MRIQIFCFSLLLIMAGIVYAAEEKFEVPKQLSKAQPQKKEEQSKTITMPSEDFNSLANQPDEVIEKIASHLSTDALDRFRRVSRRFRDIGDVEFARRLGEAGNVWRNGEISSQQFNTDNEPIIAVFVAKGRNIVSVGGRNDNRIYVWKRIGESYEKRKEIIDDDRLGDWSDFVTDASFSSEANRLALFHGNGLIGVWDVQAGKKINSFRCMGLGSIGNEIVFSPDGTKLAVMLLGGYFEMLDVMTRNSQRVNLDLPNTSILDSPAFSPDGHKLAFRERATGSTYIWNLETNKQEKQYTKNSSSRGNLKFLPDGTLISYQFNSSAVLIWDVKTGKQIFALNINVGTTGKFCFSNGGALLACCLPESILAIWNIKSGEILRKVKFENFQLPAVLAFSLDDKMIVAGGWGGDIKIWEARLS